MIPFIPAPHEEQRLRVAGYDAVKEYRRRYEEEHAGEPWLEDTSWFKPRPDWRANPDFWSVQNAGDSFRGEASNPSWFWRCIAVLFFLGQFCFWCLRLL